MNGVKKLKKLAEMTEIDMCLERADSLNDLIIIYKKEIYNCLNTITDNETLKEQIKTELGIIV